MSSEFLRKTQRLKVPLDSHPPPVSLNNMFSIELEAGLDGRNFECGRRYDLQTNREERTENNRNCGIAEDEAGMYDVWYLVLLRS